ncbi:hypothetical protein BGW38_004449, partial [Lunasporangiospora selenospora]
MARSAQRLVRATAPAAVLLLATIITFIASIGFIASPVSALVETQAGINDWHHRWIGTPYLSAVHRTSRGSNQVFVATDKNVIASIKAKTGELVWRQILREDEAIHTIRTISGNLFTLTGTGEIHARLLDSKKGQVIWDFTPVGETAIRDTTFGQAAAVTSEDSNLIILNQGRHVRKLSAKAGTELWHWAAEEGSPTTYFALLEAKGFGAHTNVIYVVGLNRGIEALSIEVVALDSITGEYIKTFAAKSKISTFEDVLILGGAAAEKSGYVAWSDEDSLKVLTLGSDRASQTDFQTIVNQVPSLSEFVSKMEMVSLKLPDGHTKFVVAATVGEYNDAKGAGLIDIDEKTGELKVVHDFGDRTGFSSFSAATYPGANDKVIVVRAFRGDSDKGVLEFVDLSDSPITTRHELFPLDFEKFAHFTFMWTEMFTRGAPTPLGRVYFATMDGSFHAYSDVAAERWYREESLAYARDVEILDLPERKLWTQDVNEAGQSSEATQNSTLLNRYIQRLTSHVLQLKDLPAFLVSYANPSSLFTKAPVATPYSEVSIGAALYNTTSNYVKRPVPDDGEGGDAETASQDTETVSTHNTTQLYRDHFGVRKILIFSTDKGKVVAMDSGNKGEILWSRFFAWGHDIKNLVVVRQAHVRLPPVLAMVSETSDGGGNKVIRLYRLNALTGEDFQSDNFFFPASAWIPAGYANAFKLPLEDPDEKTHILAIVDERMHITTFPSTPAAESAFKDFAEDFYFTLEANVGAIGLRGFKPIVSGDMRRMDVEQVWSFPFPKGEQIAAIAERPSYEVMASLGRVLGDRGVMYKYQNPNFATVITENINAEVPYLRVYLVDVVRGSILYEAKHENIGLTQPILATQYENNVVYTFWSEGETSTSAKGFQAVALELYESKNRNQRAKSDTFSSFADERPYVLGQSFPFPHAATAIGVTSTKAGISSKDILFGLSRRSIMTMNKRFLDPRRPTAPPTALEKEEMLIPYSPLTDDPRLLLSYDLEVAGVRRIATAPTLLESTTVVVAYGQDIFVTRHAPSQTFDILNEDFSKSQLLLTIVALVGVMIITAPM